MPKRVQSPSSINLYRQCPRRYFYQYILKMPTKPSIHLVRGFIVHEILENFFSLDVNGFDPADYESGMRNYVTAYLTKLWKKNEEKLRSLRLTQDELEFYLIDSQQMLTTFIKNFSKKLNEKMHQGLDIKQAFEKLSPQVELEIRNDELSVRGFIDAIHKEEEEVVLMDYKTSKKDDLTDAYRLQLAIYALLYKEKFGVLPKRVGINFLKFGEKLLEVDEQLLQFAKDQIAFVHENTESENIDDYERKVTPLCKWSKGQCDFYDVCKPPLQ